MKQFLIGVAFFLMVFLVWGSFYYAALTTDNGVELILANAPLWSVLVGIPTVFLAVFQFLRNWHKKNIATNYRPELDTGNMLPITAENSGQQTSLSLSEKEPHEVEHVLTRDELEHIQATGEVDELKEGDIEQAR